MSSATLSPPPATASFSSSFLLPHPIQIPFNATRRRRFLLRDSSKRYRALASLPDDSEGARPEYTPWLIAGLGNPGNKYQGTRHNVSFPSTHFLLASTVHERWPIFFEDSLGRVPFSSCSDEISRNDVFFANFLFFFRLGMRWLIISLELRGLRWIQSNPRRW